MSSIVFAPIMLAMAMVIYLVFAFVRRATSDPGRERDQLAETDRRLSEIDKAAERNEAP